MSQPTPYTRKFSFTNDQTANPSTKTPGNQLDIEYNAILITLSQIIANLGLIQRDDGELANGSVGFDQLSVDILTGVTPATIWTTATAYSVGNTVFNGQLLYRCLVAHTSGVFATDLAAAKWLKIADFTAAGGVSSFGAATGAIVLGTGLTMAGQTLNVAGVKSLGAQTGDITLGAGLSMVGSELDVTAVKSFATLVGDITIGGGFSMSGQQLTGQFVRYDAAQGLSAAQRTQARANTGAALRGHLAGLVLSTAGASASFSVASGEAADSTGVALMPLAASISKNNSPWNVGNGNGSLDTGSLASVTWYHVHLIQRPDTGVVDVLTSLSATAPTLPANYTLFRRIGAMRTDVSGNWTKFTQVEDKFLWDVPIASVSAFAATTTQSLQTVSVPLGVSVVALLHFLGTNTAGSGVTYLVNSGLGSAQAAGVPQGNFTVENPASSVFGACDVQILTNTSGQVGVSASSSVNNQVYLITVGWIDTRGRFA
jgi:hypothetical protein